MENEQGNDELKQPESKSGMDGIGAIETETVSKAESKSAMVMTIGDGSPQLGHNLVEASVAMISPADAGQHLPGDRTKIVIKYPKDWKKDRHFKDGDVREVAPETAIQFVKSGFATIVEQLKSE